LHDQHWVYVSDDVSRTATSDDINKMAQCARVLIYEITPPARNNNAAIATPAIGELSAQNPILPKETENKTTKLVQTINQL
jgi:hypothetical protein